tara:strand:+ start:170 stop:403 length:234 start_codon:yes stop_codon:yes gene_type:complete
MTKKIKPKKYQWNYSTDDKYSYTLEEYILKVHDIIVDSVEHVADCEGDMLMSEYRKLIDGSWRLEHLKKQIEGEEVK